MRTSILLCLFATACGPGMMMMGSMTVTSSAFTAGGTIPLRYAENQTFCGMGGTTAGMNISPPLSWSGAPSGTMSFAVSMDDTFSAPAFNHWMVWDIPAATTSLAEGAATTVTFPQGSDYGMGMYKGPCPPTGETHPYKLTVYALSASTLGVAGGQTSPTAFRNALTGKTLAEGSLTANFAN
jgi:Raf kinase inhibitor-like YbhB/YbcL family protein